MFVVFLDCRNDSEKTRLCERTPFFPPGGLTCTKKPYSKVGMFLQWPPAWDEKNNSISCLVVICAGALAAGTATV